jgi:aspartyl-tRNA(Asn)/glutamyl-tRNA(Gln) amidotransferase subunit A
MRETITTTGALARVEALQRRVQSDDPALRHVFTDVFDELAIDQARAADARETTDQPLNGVLISIKDLFDVQGYVTRAGSRFMADDGPASEDAPPIRQLREAGAVFLGHTSMTELAYSGLGLNPHYGTPDNPVMPGCIPGGSSAGGAVSVALGIADIAIGTDTGGSLRIPAAFNRIVGFKPSQHAISRAGCKALSRSLDSVGPMAASVRLCSLAFEAMRYAALPPPRDIDPVLVIPDNYGMDDLEPTVATAFDHAVSKLSAAGFTVQTRTLSSLEHLKELAVWHFAAIEARAEYDDAYRLHADLFDPRVSSRMARADSVSAVEYRKTINLRRQLMDLYRQEMQNQALLMPTVPILPPPLRVFDDDELYARFNLQVLRNTSIANVMDCCSISLPVMHSEAPVAVMLSADASSDHALLALATRCEALLAG